MSHFTVGVIVKNIEDLSGALAPYQENNMGDCPKKYMKFTDVEEEERNNYETKSIKKAKLPNGNMVYPWQKEAKECANVEIIEIPLKQVYSTFDEYIEKYVGYRKDQETGKYGYWENPNAKWDWYVVGGRWSDSLRLKNGKKQDGALIKDIDFSLNKHMYDKAIRFWELKVEELPLNEGERNPDTMDFLFYKKEYFINQYGTKENYAKKESTFSTYAMITLDGVWHETGSMGWFGLDDATKESRETYLDSFYKEIAKPENQDCYFVVVDCHI